MAVAIGYTRVSTSEQVKSGLGLEAQAAAIARFAIDEGFEMVDVITEVGGGDLLEGYATASDHEKEVGDEARMLP